MDLFIEHGRYREPHPGRVGADDAPYSVAQEEYRAERAFDRRRTRVRKLRAALRMLILLIFVPVLLIRRIYGLICDDLHLERGGARGSAGGARQLL